MTDNQIYWKTSNGRVFRSEDAARRFERFLRVEEAIKGKNPPEYGSEATAIFVARNALDIVKALRLTDDFPKEYNADGTERFCEIVPFYRDGKFTMRKFYKGGEVTIKNVVNLQQGTPYTPPQQRKRE